MAVINDHDDAESMLESVASLFSVMVNEDGQVMVAWSKFIRELPPAFHSSMFKLLNSNELAKSYEIFLSGTEMLQ